MCVRVFCETVRTLNLLQVEVDPVFFTFRAHTNNFRRNETVYNTVYRSLARNS